MGCQCLFNALGLVLSDGSVSISFCHHGTMFAMPELSRADSTLPGIDFSFCSHRFEASTLLTESGVMTEPFTFTDHG